VTSGDNHQVLPFRPRNSIGGSIRRVSAPHREPDDDLSRYENESDEPDDFRHRMIANALTFVFVGLLTAAGIWIAISMADLRAKQDCVLANRRDCSAQTIRGG
jgi:hypothetical protein